MAVWASLKKSSDETVTSSNFSKFVREKKAAESPFEIMRLFSTYFDKDGKSFVNKDEFIQGLTDLQREEPNHVLITKLQSFLTN